MSRKGGEVVKEGFLTKSPPVDKALATRKRRYFVLWSNGIFEYYSSAAKRPQDYLKTVDLNACEDMVAPITLQGRENIIRLTIKQGDKVRDYFLEAENRPEMDQWVSLLARVCGFSPVEEVVDYSMQLDASVSSLQGVAPRNDLQTRPPINFPSPMTTPYPTPNSEYPPTQSTRPPLPPPKPKRPPELDQPQYIQPGLDSENGIKDSMYFLLSPTGETVLQDGPQGAYEEMEYDHEELNRNPPPLWKPPPQPTRNPSSSSTSSIIYSRVEGGKIVDHPFTGNSPHRAHHNMMFEVPKQRKPIKKPNTGQKDDARMNATKPHAPSKQKKVGTPAPPTKPKQAPHWGQEKNPLQHILNDPNLMGKLHEKRQELYGPVDAPRASLSSCGSDNPMENYEEVCFDLVGFEDEEQSSAAFSRVTNMTLPPRRHNIGSQIAMVQCPPEESKVQEYLSFKPSPSHSPRESTTDLANGDLHTAMPSLSPRVQRKVTETQPELPPRDVERMRGGSPRLVRKPISAAANFPTRQQIPPAPRAHSRQPLKERSTSQEELRKNRSSKPRGLPPRPASSSFEEPPLVPFRSTSTKDESLSHPYNQRNLSVPLPLPSVIQPPAPQPPLRQNRHFPNVKCSSDDDCSSPPPPIPVRQTSVSSGTLSMTELGQSTPISSSASHDAPPVPSRGHRQSDLHSTPSLHRPNLATDAKPQATPKTPVILTPREADIQPPATLRATNRPDVRIPRTKPIPPPPVSSKPPVSTKPPKPPVSSKPPISLTKPPVSTKPPVGTRIQPRGEITSQTASRRPPHVPRQVSASHQNGEYAPPLPPR